MGGVPRGKSKNNIKDPPINVDIPRHGAAECARQCQRRRRPCTVVSSMSGALCIPLTSFTDFAFSARPRYTATSGKLGPRPLPGLWVTSRPLEVSCDLRSRLAGLGEPGGVLKDSTEPCGDRDIMELGRL